MATCLKCRGKDAKVVSSRPVIEGDHLVIWRFVTCPPEPGGCGKTRLQIIRDEGPTERREVPREEGPAWGATP